MTHREHQQDHPSALQEKSRGMTLIPATAAVIPIPGTVALQTPARVMTNHRYRAIVFDWDGTAVNDRQEDATVLAQLAEALLARNIWLVVVTGTNFPNIDRQFCQHIDPEQRHHLLVCANRGSEVFGFDQHGTTLRRWLRQATAAEDAELTAIANEVRDQLVAQTGLSIAIIANRLNRRKIDLIPLAEWTDPPKAQIGALLAAVEHRLQAGGLAGGLGAAIVLAEQSARTHHLDVRITSDVKHIEIGLTDKGDAVVWIERDVLAPAAIAFHDVLILGDEFGPVGGFAGSDERLASGVGDATIISVGPEPNGVPNGVQHHGGGPAHFRALLAEQIWLHREKERQARDAPTDGHREDDTLWFPLAEPEWSFVVAGYVPSLEHDVESRLTVSNGFLGARGSLEQPTHASFPRLLVASVFDEQHRLPALASLPDWLHVALAVDGIPLSFETGELIGYTRRLDLQRGVLYSEWWQSDALGRSVWVRTLRFVSLAQRSLGGHIMQIEVAQPSQLTLSMWPDLTGTTLRRAHDTPRLAVWHATGIHHTIAVASAVTVHSGDHFVSADMAALGLTQHWQWPVHVGEPVTVAHIIAVTRNDAMEDGGDTALLSLEQAQSATFSQLLAAHESTWRERWDACAIAIVGNDADQRALRFMQFHLIGAANPSDEYTSIGARALTGDAYLGHVFWDTEIFALPFYTFTWPAAARALLMYRYHTLPAARAKATRLGYHGAFYAWESADTGAESTPTSVRGPDGKEILIRCGTLEQHISADIAYAVWQYWQATGDETFLVTAGAEILLETARFWASRASLEADGCYHIRQVIGPDEYHEGIDDNAFTNGMAQWNLARGREVTQLLQSRWQAQWDDLSARLTLTVAEVDHWHDVATRLETGFDASTGLFAQFAGFFDLDPVAMTPHVPQVPPIDMVLGSEKTRRSQVIKQADVVMLLALLWENYPAAVRAANFRYYEPKCAHGSSLSPGTHALVAARLGDEELAAHYMHLTTAIDLDDTLGTAAQGIHIAAQGGLWQTVVLGFAGMSLLPEGLQFDPHLPPTWEVIRFPMQWHQSHVRVAIQGAPLQMQITHEDGQPLLVTVGGLTRLLHMGQTWTCHWHAAEQSWLEVAQ